MSDYTEHLISMAGGDGDVATHRVQAAMKAHREAPRTRGLDTTGPMRAALAASDAVMFSDDAVERAAKAIFAEEQCDRRQKLDVESNWRGRLNDRDRDEYRRLTRAGIAALREADK